MSNLGSTIVSAVVVIVLGVAGCGESDEPRTSGQTSPEESATTDMRTTQPSEGAVATEVSYSRSGGIAGEQTSYTFTADEPPPPGFTAQQQDEVLDAASDPTLRDLELEPLPKDLCCDLFVYEVTITWADGTSGTFATADGVAVPPALDALLQAAG